MHNLAVQIVRFVDSDFPGWVECELVDAAGKRHVMEGMWWALQFCANYTNHT
jgi:hypothetical protein